MRLKKDNSPFVILGVDEKATDEEVKEAYRKRAMRYHPDRNQSEDAEEQFKRIQTAYALIKDESSRRQVAKIIHMYGDAAAKGGWRPGEEGKGKKPLDPSHFEDARESESVGFFPGVAFIAELFLAFRMALRLERIPFKMILFTPFMLIAHWFHTSGELTEPLVIKGLWQAALGSLITDMMCQAAELSNRYRLRLIVNRYVVWALIGAAACLALSTDIRGEAVITYFNVNVDLLRAAATMAVSLAVYFWFVFCFFFQKHDPKLEIICIWIGVAGGMYFWFVLYA